MVIKYDGLTQGFIFNLKEVHKNLLVFPRSRHFIQFTCIISLCQKGAFGPTEPTYLIRNESVICGDKSHAPKYILATSLETNYKVTLVFEDLCDEKEITPETRNAARQRSVIEDNASASTKRRQNQFAANIKKANTQLKMCCVSYALDKIGLFSLQSMTYCSGAVLNGRIFSFYFSLYLVCIIAKVFVILQSVIHYLQS